MLSFLQTVTDLLKKAYKQISILLNKKHNAVSLLVGPVGVLDRQTYQGGTRGS
jgi:3-phosphoglycerate kinase